MPKRCLPGYVGRYCRAKCIYPFNSEESVQLIVVNIYMRDVTVGCRALTDGKVMISI